ncbi:digestive organ expansion factor [Pyricularia oryzae 70-15]|uniref:U3 small nucleolar RNA-associated protein 25 n=3 Tax=Pyricularia oryzae TaxID=318829 RepID=UTP25_PYRO7|nr:digestive organ expansion factor [Pyricularia oryzae 70-15]A4R0E6.2 RecName: Full=U3 small nucleolar RNA-associated protein 25; Short=U3 snoRNA-associated protein 25; AltName: Full=U three protein 25 [Pyricularia oryzae 70-15]ELQ33480.1 digestive organ expansion factor [Pyricularia oryzae Y34]KAI7918743.1 digestive organ expansion factor [Pyricularia oryzae]EHA57469.1 digestive organ expansion factor [Pyricularia oryzae 70-15]KAI7919435.1 digestive organ expansion factor [Pyricularia oryzae
MGPRGRGGSRGGSFRGGGSRGRGRGRGRGGVNRFGKRPRFDSARVEDKEKESEEESLSEAEEDSEVPESESSDESVAEEAPTRPYMALLRSLSKGSGIKRRKLDHEPNNSEESGEDDSSESSADEDAPDDVCGDVDLVDEPEEDHDEIMEQERSDDEDEKDLTDSFNSHFASPDEVEVAERIKSITNHEWVSKRLPSKSARTVLTLPKQKDASDNASGPVPVTNPATLILKPKLKESITSQRPQLDASEQALAAPLFQYYDTLYCQRTVANGHNLRRLVCLHALNHIFKTRDRVIKNSAKLAKESADPDLEFRDQGFTRPKVLMLLPTRNSCAKMIEMMCSLTETDQQENRKRFDDSYVTREKQKFSNDKPTDFRDLFEGNADDMFRLGVKFTRKTIKFFSQFYNSDILLASPLGLRMAMGSTEEKNLDHDFLSSIEIVIMDQADAILMQNWEHVEHIFEHLNRQPKEAHGADFSRIRSWYLDGQSKNYRQTVILSSFNNPDLSEVMRVHCHNWQGKIRIQPDYQGVIQQLGVKVKQTFSRFDAQTIIADPDARFEYFIKAVVPSLTKRVKDSCGTLVFIPSYMDFVRVRNWFATSPAAQSLSFGVISEHTEVSETSRARSHFVTGRQKVLLYTERCHHFWRHQLRGVRRVIFYGLPDNPVFYKEIAGGCLGRSEQDMTLEPGEGSVRAMFSKYDVMKLERVVGTPRVGKMLHEKGDTFDFV